MITFVGVEDQIEILKKFFALDTIKVVEENSYSPVLKAEFPIFSLHVEDKDIHKHGIVIPMQDDIAARFSKDLLDYKNVIVSPSAYVCYDRKLFEEYAKVSQWGEFYPFPQIGNVILKYRFSNSDKKSSYQLLVSLSGIPNDYIAQEYIPGGKYIANCFFDNDGHYLYGVVQKEIKAIDRYTLEAQIVDEPEIIAICKLFDSRLNDLVFRGAISIQFIKNEFGPKIIGIIPRLSDNYAVSIEAGMPAHKWTLDLVRNRPIFTDTIEIKKIRVIRSFRDHYFSE